MDKIFTIGITRTVLWECFTIPSIHHQEFYEKLGTKLFVGDKVPIRVIIRDNRNNGEVKEYEYDAIVSNINYDKCHNHSEVLKIRYPPTSLMASRLRNIFSKTNNYIEEHPPGKNKVLKIPEDQKEFMDVCSSGESNIIILDCHPK